MATSGAASVKGVGHAGHEVGRPGPSSHGHAGATHHAPPCVRAERGGLLVPRIDGADAQLDAGGLGLQHGAAHHVEHRVDALDFNARASSSDPITVAM